MEEKIKHFHYMHNNPVNLISRRKQFFQFGNRDLIKSVEGECMRILQNFAGVTIYNKCL